MRKFKIKPKQPKLDFIDKVLLYIYSKKPISKSSGRLEGVLPSREGSVPALLQGQRR